MNVISYALFGTNQYPIETIVRANALLFRDWKIRIHHDAIALQKRPVLKEYENEGLVQLVELEPTEQCRAMLWRLLPLYDQNVEHFICRDMDSLPMLRDRRVVEEFIRSGAAVHCVNDNPAHNIPMMGGLIGFNNRAFWSLPGARHFPKWDLLVRPYDLTAKGSDQMLLEQRVWPIAQQSLCEHRMSGFGLTEGAKFSYTRVPQIFFPDIDALFFGECTHPVYGTQCPRGDSYANYMGACGFRDTDALVDFQAVLGANALRGDSMLERITRAEQRAESKVDVLLKLEPWQCGLAPLVAVAWQAVGKRPGFVCGLREEEMLKDPAAKSVLDELRSMGLPIQFMCQDDRALDASVWPIKTAVDWKARREALMALAPDRVPWADTFYGWPK